VNRIVMRSGIIQILRQFHQSLPDPPANELRTSRQNLLKQVEILLNLVFSPFQWTSDISPQFIRGWAIAIGAKSQIILLCWMALSQSVQAQVIADDTLLRPSVVNINGNQFKITGGTRAGTNLFHSFRQFSVPTGGTASFQQVEPAIANIITRVTGASISRIDGLIEALQSNGQISSADLFLINPNSIIFGTNASLNIGGSFLATTGDRLSFADATQFNADGTQSSSLLTVSVPSGLQMGATPGAIVHRSRANLQFSQDFPNDAIAGGLQVAPGRTLALVGGQIRLPGGVLVAESGRIELGAIGNASVDLTRSGAGWRLAYAPSSRFQDLRFSQAANVSVSGAGGGSIQIQGRQIHLTDQSFISAFTLGDLDGEPIQIQAEHLRIDDRSLIRSFTQGAGTGGNISIGVEQLDIESGGQIAVNTNASGNSGSIRINADTITLKGGDDIQGNTFFSTGLFSQARSEATGNGGQLAISTGALNILEGAQVNTVTFGAGNAGNIQVRADRIHLAGVIQDRSGTVIYTPGNPRPYPSGFFTATRNNATGDGGLLRIETTSLRLEEGAAIKTNTEGRGDSGSIAIDATEQIEVLGRVPEDSLPSFILTSSGGVAGIDESGVNTATGRSGSLRIRTRELRVDEGAIAVGSANPDQQNTAGAGTLRIRAAIVSLDNQGRLLADTASGNGGNIRLELDNLLQIQNRSQISTTAGTAQQGGDGGDIAIRANFIVTAPTANSDITANAFTGTGGNIRINAEGILGIQPRSALTASSDITASSTFGRSGTIDINAAEVDLKRELTSLPAEFLRARLDQRCQSRGDGSVSRFTETGQGGLPPSPRELDEAELWQDWRSLDAPGDRATTPTENRSPPEPPVEAQGWVRDPQGKIQLIAQSQTVVPYSSWQSPPHCHSQG
jgi:filamentous hemagglutinin family protein